MNANIVWEGMKTNLFEMVGSNWIEKRNGKMEKIKLTLVYKLESCAWRPIENTVCKVHGLWNTLKFWKTLDCSE